VAAGAPLPAMATMATAANTVLRHLLVLLVASRAAAARQQQQALGASFHLPRGTGVTLKLYDNLGLSGAPSASSVLPTAAFEHNAERPFSAEMVGTLAFPATGGVFRFDCNWTHVTMGYVWVDGHMVCQDPFTYKPGAGTTDNPLPVNTFKRSKGIVPSLPFRAHFYFNGQTSPPAPPPPNRPKMACTGMHSVGVFDDHGHKCGFKQAGGMNMGDDWAVAAAACSSRGYKFAGATASKGQEIWCGNTATPSCPKAPSHKPAPCPGNHSQTCGDAWFLEVIAWDACHPLGPAPPTPAPAPPAPPSGPAMAGLSITWAKGATRAESLKAVAAPIPSADFTSSLPAEEAQRDALQRSMVTGWGPWLHANMLALVKLPEAATLTTKICEKSTGKCMASAVPDGARPRPGNRPGVATRVGLHAYDRSYVQFFVGPSPDVATNVSIEYSSFGDGNSEIVALITCASGGGTAVATAAACSGFELVLEPRYAFLKTGSVNATSSAIDFTPPGCPAFSLRTTASGSVSGGGSASSSLHLDLSNGPVGVRCHATNLSCTGQFCLVSPCVTSALATKLILERGSLPPRPRRALQRSPRLAPSSRPPGPRRRHF
jgi:hypothetical protein